MKFTVKHFGLILTILGVAEIYGIIDIPLLSGFQWAIYGAVLFVADSILKFSLGTSSSSWKRNRRISRRIEPIVRPVVVKEVVRETIAEQDMEGLRCPHCNAPVSFGGQDTTQCKYCGTEIERGVHS